MLFNFVILIELLIDLDRSFVFQQSHLTLVQHAVTHMYHRGRGTNGTGKNM